MKAGSLVQYALVFDSPLNYRIYYISVVGKSMGFWLGSLIFACLEVVGFLGVEGILGKQYRRERLDNRLNNKNTLYVGYACF